MPRGGVNKADGRDYSYDKHYESSETQKKRRSGRNLARAKMERSGRVSKGDGKDVDHRNHNTRDNGSKNLRVMSAHHNRSIK
jgi:hypothetical protein